MGHEQSSTRELIASVMGSGDATERELVLIDRLQSALDEVDALQNELRGYQYAQAAQKEASVPRQIEKTYRVAQYLPALVVTSVRNGIIAVLGAAALVAGTAAGSGLAERIKDDVFRYELNQPVLDYFDQ